MKKIITLAHGSGGKLMHDLIDNMFRKNFNSEDIDLSGDSAYIELSCANIAFTTDSYVVNPLFFSGGNIGRLAVCGTVNDLTVSGAKPLYLTCSLIIEEGLELEVLESIVDSMAKTAKEAGVKIVTGDTKVVERGAADKLFINTSGVGVMLNSKRMSTSEIKTGDKVIVTGTIGDHEAAILVERENFKVSGAFKSDCAPLNILLEPVFKNYINYIRIVRDPTRGGIATTLNEFVKGENFGIRLFEEKIPIKNEVIAICEMLGIDPLYMANEGKALLVVDSVAAVEIMNELRCNEYGKDSEIIGEVCDELVGKVYMDTLVGGTRIVDMLVGEQLPRIC